MSEEEILKKVQEISINVLKDKDIELNYITNLYDIEGWDSLNLIELIAPLNEESPISNILKNREIHLIIFIIKQI